MSERTPPAMAPSETGTSPREGSGRLEKKPWSAPVITQEEVLEAVAGACGKDSPSITLCASLGLTS